MNKKTHTIVCGHTHSVAITTNNTLNCWGNNKYNQCDPVHNTFTDVIQVACGAWH